jgi:ABC-type dipeptide/oligopeptide/nickel transport system ATPase subunit
MLVQAERLAKSYPLKSGTQNRLRAVKEASLHLAPGETVGLLGNSGSGKSTLGMMLAGLIRPDGGEIRFKDRLIAYPFHGAVRRDIQILFQHPEVSFNPALPVIYSLWEPYKLYDKPYTKAKLLRDMEKMGLYEKHLRRFPSELSGGELQRLALIRLMVLKPSFLVLDEPTSMLDVISQAQIFELLKDYQKAAGAAFLLITHHKLLARTLCRRIYTMEDGVLTAPE